MLQIDDLREIRQIYQEHEEWVRDEEQYRRNWWPEWDPWNSRIAPTETDLMDARA